MNFGGVLLLFLFVASSAMAEFNGDTELSGVHPTAKGTSLFVAVEQFMDFFVTAPIPLLDQKEIQEIPLSPDFAAFEIKQQKTSTECPTDEALKKLKEDLQDSKNFESLWNDPLFFYHGRKDFNLQERNWEDPAKIVDLVFFPLSHASLPLNSSSPIDLRFRETLRKINVEELKNLAMKAFDSRGQMIALAQRGCVVLGNLRKAEELLAETSATLAKIFILEKAATEEQSFHPTVPFSTLNSAERRVLSLYVGAFLWRYRGYGGYSELGTSGRRSLFVATGFAQIARINGAKPNELNFATALKWGVQWTSWGRYHDLGRLNDTEAADLAKMEELGGRLVLGAEESLRFQGDPPNLLSLAGQQMGRCYDKGWNSVPNQLLVGTEFHAPLAPILMGPSNYGELCTGASLGLAISKIFQQRIPESP